MSKTCKQAEAAARLLARSRYPDKYVALDADVRLAHDGANVYVDGVWRYVDGVSHRVRCEQRAEAAARILARSRYPDKHVALDADVLLAHDGANVYVEGVWLWVDGVSHRVRALFGGNHE